MFLNHRVTRNSKTLDFTSEVLRWTCFFPKGVNQWSRRRQLTGCLNYFDLLTNTFRACFSLHDCITIISHHVRCYSTELCCEKLEFRKKNFGIALFIFICWPLFGEIRPLNEKPNLRQLVGAIEIFVWSGRIIWPAFIIGKEPVDAELTCEHWKTKGKVDGILKAIWSGANLSCKANKNHVDYANVWLCIWTILNMGKSSLYSYIKYNVGRLLLSTHKLRQTRMTV